MMPLSKDKVMMLTSYQSQAEQLVRNYVLADPFLPYTSVLGGIFACKMAYELTQLISSFYFKSYAGLTKMQRFEWNNRGMSTLHAIFITVMSLYLVFFSELYSDQQFGLVPFRSSPLSTFALGGYVEHENHFDFETLWIGVQCTISLPRRFATRKDWLAL